MAFKLGKRPARHDPRTLRARQYLPPTLPAPPPCDWSTSARHLGPMLNDRIGDCGLAGPGHYVQLATAANGREFVPPDADIERAYRDVGHYDGTPETDNGVFLIDSMNYWRRPTGIAGHSILAYASVDLHDVDAFRRAVYYYGPLVIGLALPQSSELQDNAGEWSLAMGGTKGDPSPGSRGGHCVLASGWNDAGVPVITWGLRFTLTWDFLDAYCDEAYAVVSDDWGDADGAPGSELMIDELFADLAQVSA